MTIAQWLEKAAAELKSTGVDSAHLDAGLILSHSLQQEKTYIIAHSEQILTNEHLSVADEKLAKRKQHIPLAYILKQVEFYNLKLFVDERVLVPRPETEALVTAALDLSGKTMLDIGTGSGAIALAIKLNQPELSVTATDISEQALEVARINAGTYSAELKLINSNLFSKGKFDIITANLPYVPVGKSIGRAVKHEPDLALYSGKDGLDLIREFVGKLKEHLDPQGSALIEHLPNQFDEISVLAADQGLEVKQISDYVSLLTYA